MARKRHFQVRTPSARTIRRAGGARSLKTKPHAGLPRLRCADRKALLLGTALASTLVIGTLLSPPPASAVVACPPAAFPPPGPISIVNPGDDIACTNVFDRYNNAGNVIVLSTNGANEFIDLDNSGDLAARMPPALPLASSRSRMATTAQSRS